MGESTYNKQPCDYNWKGALRQEIMDHVKDQMKERKQEVIYEIKPLL